MKRRKLTPALLRRIVLEEAAKLADPIASGTKDVSKLKTAEVDADDLANTLESDIDYIKALKIQESRLRNKMKKVKRAQKRARGRVLSRVIHKL